MLNNSTSDKSGSNFILVPGFLRSFFTKCVCITNLPGASSLCPTRISPDSDAFLPTKIVIHANEKSAFMKNKNTAKKIKNDIKIKISLIISL